MGSAVPDRLLEWRIERLQELGCNAYRTAHNPPAAELLEICDRLGMLVIDETRIMSADEEALSQLSRLVRRDRNHPCVILWSLGNEEPHQATERGARVARTMKQLVRQLDPSRPCMYAMDQGFGAGVSQVVDVLGFNYRTDQMEAFHKRFPDLPILGSETGSTVCTRGIYRRDDAKGYVPAYDTDHPWWATTAQSWWTYVANRPYIAGGFVWTGFDYRGEPTPFNRWPSISSHFGIMDTCGFPKDNYYYYQAQWRDRARAAPLAALELAAGREDRRVVPHQSRQRRVAAQWSQPRSACRAAPRACSVAGEVRAGRAGSPRLSRWQADPDDAAGDDGRCRRHRARARSRIAARRTAGISASLRSGSSTSGGEPCPPPIMKCLSRCAVPVR